MRVNRILNLSRIVLVVCAAALGLPCYAVASMPDMNKSDSARMFRQDTSEAGSLLRNQGERSTGDVVTDADKSIDSTFKYLTLPGPDVLRAIRSAQERAFKRAQQLKIDPHSRFRIGTQIAANNWRLPLGTERDSMLAIFNLPPGTYDPGGQQIVQHQLALLSAEELPNNIGGPRATRTLTGFQLPLSTLGKALGFTKDVSPTLRYFVRYRTEVEIVIYSPQAKVIARLMKQNQDIGGYQRTWNGRNDRGQRMPAGDYIGEVRIGRETIIRKHIQLP